MITHYRIAALASLLFSLKANPIATLIQMLEVAQISFLHAFVDIFRIKSEFQEIQKDCLFQCQSLNLVSLDQNLIAFRLSTYFSTPRAIPLIKVFYIHLLKYAH